MKNVMERGWMVVLAFVLVSAFSITTTKAQGSVSLQVFYDELEPYGTWMDYGTYGYVWIPRVDRNFVPYGTNGYWIHTEYGNTWVSDYSWGWAPFHYGRWLFDDFYGWIWVPDTEWAPAWVAWRSGGGYYGWAPLMPGIGIHLTFQHYDRIPHHYWNFVPYRYVTYRHVYRHCVPRPRVVNIYHHTTIINNNYTDNKSRTYFSGPSRHEIEKRGGGRVTVHKVSETSRPGRTEVSHSTANFYRPEIDNSRESRSKSLPGRYVKKDESGNVREVVTRTRPKEYNSSRSMNDVRNNTSREQKNNEVKALDGHRNNVTREVQRGDYTPSQRTRPSVNKEPSRSYETIQRARESNVRDRYEAPPVQRAPMNRDVQRGTNSQPQQWRQIERQNTTPPRENVQPQHNRSSDLNRRSTVQPSQRSTQFRKSNADNNNNRQPSRSMGRRFKD